MKLINGYLTYKHKKYNDLTDAEKIEFRNEIIKVKKNENPPKNIL